MSVAHHQAPQRGDIIFQSTGLRFTDGIREISSLHFASFTTEICECHSSCDQHSYHSASGCQPCPPHSGTISNGSISIDQCLCLAGYEHSDEDPDIACVPVKVEIYEYSPEQLILNGFCQRQPGSSTCTADTGISLENKGCSCSDFCLFRNISDVKAGARCCRNKCVICVGALGASRCDCRYDMQSRRAYNRASVSGELCSGYRCAPGERSSQGLCVPCQTGTYQDKVLNMASPTCKTCRTCSDGKYLAGCGIANPGICRRCTICPSDQVEIRGCSEFSDTVCSNSRDCTQFGVECPQGYYHAGCDPAIGEKGWCERCPIQDANSCPDNYFLNFQCTNGAMNTSALSLVPNECVPCNRFKCNEPGDFYPSVSDCGSSLFKSKYAPNIRCTSECTRPNVGQWIERVCQVHIANQTRFDDTLF